MDPSEIGVFDLAERRLAWLDRRATLLAQNVANVDTPGWQSRDLLPFDAALAHAGVTPARTNPLHLAGSAAQVPGARTVVGEKTPDGNGVPLDVELTKVADTETAQTLVTQLWTTYMGLFRTALGK